MEKANPRARMHNSAFSKAKIRSTADFVVEFSELFYRKIGRMIEILKACYKSLPASGMEKCPRISSQKI
jgi:hypothetical protein